MRLGLGLERLSLALRGCLGLHALGLVGGLKAGRMRFPLPLSFARQGSFHAPALTALRPGATTEGGSRLFGLVGAGGLSYGLHLVGGVEGGGGRLLELPAGFEAAHKPSLRLRLGGRLRMDARLGGKRPGLGDFRDQLKTGLGRRSLGLGLGAA